MKENKPNLHLQIAENGKVLALKGDYKEALRHYKEAMRMCQTADNSEVFLQHYSLCAMESLELMEAHEEIITFCEKSIDFLTPKKAERTDEWFRKTSHRSGNGKESSVFTWMKKQRRDRKSVV